MTPDTAMRSAISNAIFFARQARESAQGRHDGAVRELAMASERLTEATDYLAGLETAFAEHWPGVQPVEDAVAA